MNGPAIDALRKSFRYTPVCALKSGYRVTCGWLHDHDILELLHHGASVQRIADADGGQPRWVVEFRVDDSLDAVTTYRPSDSEETVVMFTCRGRSREFLFNDNPDDEGVMMFVESRSPGRHA